jgi:hypothetical protein
MKSTCDFSEFFYQWDAHPVIRSIDDGSEVWMNVDTQSESQPVSGRAVML